MVDTGAATLTRGRHLAVLLFVALMLALWIGLRLGFGIGWGAMDRAEGAEAPLGLAFNVLDNLAYAAWAEQARQGQVPFAVLQTTEPHDAIFVLPAFLAIGGLARFFGLHALLVMNLVGLACGALTLYLVLRGALALGLGFRAAFLAMAFTAFGAGLSVPLRLVYGAADWAVGADAKDLDFFPAATLPYFPYQAMGLATMAALLWVLLNAESRIAAGARPLGPSAMVFAFALLAIATRPYAPTVVTGLYLIMTLAALLRPQAPERRRARLWLATALLLGVGPLALYYDWVSLQPVWSAYVRVHFGDDRLDWLIGFGLFWPAAAAGAALGWRDARANFALFSLWLLFDAVLLLVLNSKDSKFADVSFLALALLAAYAVDRAIRRLTALPALLRVPAALLLGLCLLASSLSTLGLFAQGRGADYRPLDGELVQAACVIRAEMPAGRPAVLTDVYAGALLPTIAGLRVYVGHWALTLRPEEKVAQLRAAGFEPGGGGDTRVLDALLASAPFDYVLARKSSAVSRLLEVRRALHPVWDGARWRLYRVGRR